MTNDRCPGRFNSVSDLAGVEVADGLPSVGWLAAGWPMALSPLSLLLLVVWKTDSCMRCAFISFSARNEHFRALLFSHVSPPSSNSASLLIYYLVIYSPSGRREPNSGYITFGLQLENGSLEPICRRKC